jgi:hypothetical protein
VQVTPDVTIDPCAVVGLSCPETIPGIRSPSIDLDLGPLIQESANTSQSADLFPLGCSFGAPGCGNWQLLGFNAVDADLFQLDPEAPAIGVTTMVASGVASGAGPPGTLIQTVALENAGDVPLATVQVTDAVTPAAFEIAGVTSPRLGVNPAFDAVTDVNLLTGGDAMAAGAKDTVFAGFRVVPGTVYDFAVTAAGASPIGTAVTAAAAARFAVYPFAIRPPPVQGASQGVLPAAIPGGSGLDVRDVDPASIRLEGVPPLRWSYAPADGAADLLLFFSRQAVLAALRARLEGAIAAIASRPAASDVTAVARGVLGRPDLVGDAQRLAADQLGNANGLLDVGDLRALVRRRRAGDGGAASLLAAPPGGRSGSVGMPNGTVVTTVLTATLLDGTAVMGEDTIVLLDNGRTP